jgi:hypothetical protein
MLRWADWQRCWIEEGVYFDNKTLDEWISLKFNPGDSMALYSSANKIRVSLSSNAGHQRQPTSRIFADRRKSGMQRRGTQHMSKFSSRQNRKIFATHLMSLAN